MTKLEKDFIRESEPYVLGTPISSIFIIPSGRLYKGVWGNTGFGHMILIGEDPACDRYYYINPDQDVDVMAFFHFCTVHSIDIPHRRGGAVRVCFTTPVIVDELFSSITPKNAKTEAQLKEAN